MITRAALALVGLAFVACEVFGVYDYMLAQQGAVDYLVVGGCLVAATAPLCPTLATILWRSDRPISALGAWVACVLCITIVVGSALTRTGGAADHAEATRAGQNQLAAARARAETDARAAHKIASDEAAAICDRGSRGACATARAKRDAAAATLREAVAALGAAPVEVRDPLGARAARVGISQTIVLDLFPLATPLVMFILGTLFLTAATSYRGQEAVARGGPLPTPRGGAEIAASESPRRSGGVLKALPPPDALPRFMLESLERAPGERVRANDLVVTYNRWREANGLEPVPGREIASELSRVLDKAGIEAEAEGGKVYFLGVALKAVA